MAKQQALTRNTCFALLSSIEVDLRNTLRDQLKPMSEDMLPSDILSICKTRMQKDTGIESNEGDDYENLLSYTDFADLAKLIKFNKLKFEERIATYLLDIASRIERLSDARNRVCHSRPLEATDLSDFYELADYIKTNMKVLSWSTLNATLNMISNDRSSLLLIDIPDYWITSENSIYNNLPSPEFDDTGFLGRQKDRKDVLRLINGQHPVITIVGEGGIGKTALALRCAYDILESSNSKFDAISWVSMKTRALSNLGIREIEGAISNTLGFYSTLGESLGIPDINDKKQDEIIDEILDYMENYRILVIIDNLETIDANSIRDLLISIPAGSKILITSRVGIGEMEVRYNLEGLDQKTSLALFRRYSSILNCTSLSRLDEAQINVYVKRLFNNPLLIKWFISSVSLGYHPDSLVQIDGKQLNKAIAFCFENLYERFSEAQKMIIRILLILKRPISRTELSVICRDFGFSSNEIDWSLNSLHHSSVISIIIGPETNMSSSGKMYALSSIAASFMKTEDNNEEIYKKIRKIANSLSGEIDNNSKSGRRIKTWDEIETNSRDEKIIAIKLRKAIFHSKSGALDEARRIINECKEFSPNYSAIYRISGRIESNHNVYQADNDFDNAMQLSPNNILNLYHYSIFLLNAMNNTELAVKLMKRAMEIKPNDPEITECYAYCLMRNGNHEESVYLYEQLINGKYGPSFHVVKIRDRAAESFRRYTEYLRNNSEDEKAKLYFEKALNILMNLIDKVKEDNGIIKRYCKILSDVIYYSQSTNQRDFAAKYLDYALKNQHRFGTYLMDDRVISKFAENYSGNKYKIRIEWDKYRKRFSKIKR